MTIAPVEMATSDMTLNVGKDDAKTAVANGRTNGKSNNVSDRRNGRETTLVESQSMTSNAIAVTTATAPVAARMTKIPMAATTTMTLH